VDALQVKVVAAKEPPDWAAGKAKKRPQVQQTCGHHLSGRGGTCYLSRDAVRLLSGKELPMKLAKLSLCLAMLGLGIASAASSYKLTLPSDLSAGTVMLKAGDYKVEVEGDQATFKQGKQEIKVPVRMEKSASKFQDTTLESSGTNLQAIDIGGTTTKIVVKTAN
jgi:hypothetical protein